MGRYFQLINQSNGLALSVHQNSDNSTNLLKLAEATTDYQQQWKKTAASNNCVTLLNRSLQKNVDILDASTLNEALAVYSAASLSASQQWGLWDISKLISDIKYIEKTIGLNKLPNNLREIAELRLEFDDASLKELGMMIDPPVSKSGVNHRFRKIEQIVDELRGDKKHV